MLYEICAVIMIFIVLIVWLVNPTKALYDKFGGKSIIWDEDKDDDTITRIITIFVIGMGIIMFNIIEILFMFWTGSQGVIIAKYYALFLLITTIIIVIKNGFKKQKLKVMPKKIPIWSKVYTDISTLIMLGLIIWSLVI